MNAWHHSRRALLPQRYSPQATRENEVRNPFRRRDYERFEAPGIVLEREGRFVRMASTLDESEHSEWRKRLGESVGSIKQDMSNQVEELYAILHQYLPECVLGALWFSCTPKHVSESPSSQGQEDAIMAHVDYLATLYLRNRGSGTEFAVLPHVVEDIRQRVEAIFRTTVWLWMAEDAARHGAKKADVSRDLRFMTLMNSLVVGYPGHFDHMKEMLLGIEEEMAQDLARWLGWSIADAVAVGDAIIALIDKRMNANIARGSEEATKLWDAEWPRGSGVFARLVKRILPPHLRPWRRRYIYGLTTWVQFLMQDITTFTVDQLAIAADVEKGRVAALMKAATLPWGACGEDYFRFPHPTPPILTYPCIEVDSGSFLVPVPTSFSWAIRGLVETTLKSLEADGQASCWKAYERARASFTEREAVRLLAKALPHAGAFHSLKYTWKKEGVTIQGELDGLLLIDDTALLVEVKAGALSPEARRGAPNRLREQLGELVGKAHEQALKAKEFLTSSPNVTFYLGRNELRVQSEKINEFVLVTVNLDPLSMAVNLNQVVRLGVIGGADLPWVVSYLDLVVIADAIEYPAQMIHYLKRRRRVSELGFVVAHDELDWFGHYLEEGLFFENLQQSHADDSKKRTWSIVGFSKGLDAHYMHDERYASERPPIPRQPMPDPMKRTLRELEEAQYNGYLHLSLALLDLDWQTREEFFAQAEELVRRTREDGRGHDYTLVLDDGQSGITFMSDSDRSGLRRALSGYCQLKKYQCRCSCWVGIGRLVDTDSWVDEAIVIKQPWEYNEELEELVAAALVPLPKP